MKNKVKIRRIAVFVVIVIAIMSIAYFNSTRLGKTKAQEVVVTPLMDSKIEPQKNSMETNAASDREVTYFTQEVTSAGITMAVQSMERSGNNLIVEVRWQLKDWRAWKISKASLYIDGQEHNNAGSSLVEGLFHYRDGGACFISVKDETHEKECLPSMVGETPYRVDHVIFKDIPRDILQKSIVVKITEVNSIPNESQFCEELDVDSIEKLMEKEFPGIKLACFEDPGMSWYRIAENTPYTNDEKAIETVNQLVTEAFSGRVAGIWKFDLSD